jgi:uroporphyrinogen-III synthase
MTKKTIGVFDKPSNQNLIGELNGKNYDVFLLPRVVTFAAKTSFELDLLKFDWLIFTDCHAVEYFLQLLTDINLDTFNLDSLRICAIGEAVSDSLRMFQIHADVIPSKLDDKIVFKLICDYQSPNNVRFLITEKNTHLAELLRIEHADVTEIEFYQAEPIADLSKLKVLIQNGAVDEVIFNSPAEVNDWKLLMSPNDFTGSFSEINAVATDNQTFQYLFESGLKPQLYRQ